ncbi:MAG: NfeD family protein [Pseudomonadales bacterium]
MSFTQVHFWLILGAVLLLIEVFGFTGFLIGIAVAALATGLFSALFDSSGFWTTALLFGVLSVLFTWIYWQFFRGFNTSTDAPSLHKRAQNLVGTVFTLADPVAADAVAQFVGDTRWQVVSATGAALTAGASVRVTGVSADGHLQVTPLAP